MTIMKIKTHFNQFACTFFVMLFLSFFQTNMFGQSEFRTDSGNAVTNSINSNVYRNGRISIGEKAPTSGFPSDVKLYVRGRISQEFSGTIGRTGGSDKWSSLGESFAPTASVPKVYGWLNQSGSTSFISGVKNGSQGVIAWAGNNKRLDFDWLDSSFTPRTRMSILANGNVGIGAINPGGKLTVRSSNNQSGLESVNPNGNSHFPYSNGWSYLSGKGVIFRTNGNTERMRITTGGNVGVGTTNPAGKLTVNSPNGERGIVSLNPNGNSHFPYSNGWSYLSGKGIVFRTNGNTERMRITTAGKVGIGKTNPTYTLDINGNARVTTLFVSSDERFKKDIKGIDNALDKKSMP